MTKLTIDSVGDLRNSTTAQTTINQNFAATQTALEKTLSRDGTTPNPMEANLDMNSNRIINLPDPINDSEAVNQGTLNALIAGTGNLPAGGITDDFLVKNSNTSFDAKWQTGLPGSAIPAPTAGVRGGLFLESAPANQFGTGVDVTGSLTFAQPSAANLSNGVTGSGSVVLATSPTLVTPTLGLATATNITSPTYTFTGATSGSTAVIATAVASGTLTLPATSDTIVTRSNTETLANKTINNTNTVTLKDTLLTIQDDADTTKQANLNCSIIPTGTTRIYSFPSTSGNLTTNDNTATLQNKTLDNTNILTIRDDRFTLQDNGDTTKQAVFEASGITTATTRTLTIPNASGTLALFTDIGAVLLNTLTASSSASLDDTTSLTATYNTYMIVLDNIVPATNNVNLFLRIRTGGSFQTTSYSNITGATTSAIDFQGGGANLSNTTASGGLSAIGTIHNVNNTTHNKHINFRSTIYWNGTNYISTNTGGAYTGAQTAVTGVQLLASSGNLASGVMRIYGLKGT